MNPQNRPLVLLASAFLWSAGGCTASGEIATNMMSLEAACIEDPIILSASDWLCPAPHVVECNREILAPTIVFFVPSFPCADAVEVRVTPEVIEVGTNHVTIFVDSTAVCEATLEAVDTEPPTFVQVDHELWPPNHRMHSIRPEDCVRGIDACDPEPEVRFLWATSDEPFDAEGDGSHSPDIELDVLGGSISLRAERQGGGDRRVYTLGVLVTDHVGNHIEGACRVSVPHDQSGDLAVDSGSAESVEISAGSSEM